MLITTQRELRERFWQGLGETDPDLAKLRRSRKTQNDYSADVRQAWCDFIEAAHRDGWISDALVNRATL